MKALILVGGEGTRLRPLTFSTPKPLIPLVNRPFLDHVLHQLHRHGVDDVVLTVGYRSERFSEAYGDGSHLGMWLTYVHEDEPLGTGGAIKNAAHTLTTGEAFFVFNGDILTDLDLTDMLRYHRESGSVCTISLTPVEDPSAYGVVDMDDTGRITRFTEKPKREEATSNWINAGTYILDPEVLNWIPEGQHYMVERGLFPTLLREGKPLYGYRSEAYWMDIGTPAKYLQAQADILAGKMEGSIEAPGERAAEGVIAGEGTFLHAGAEITGPVVLGNRCHVERGAVIRGPVVLRDDCHVGGGARLSGVLAWDGVSFGAMSESRNCVLANNASVGEGSRLDGSAVIGEGAKTGKGNYLSNGIKIAPGAELPDGAISF